MRTLPFLLESQLPLLIVVLVLSTSPVLTTLCTNTISAQVLLHTYPLPLASQPYNSNTYFSLILRHIVCSAAECWMPGMCCAASLPWGESAVVCRRREEKMKS